MTVKGQDWASYQSSTPTTTGLDFVFIKATEGTGYVNPRMASQVKAARSAGLVVGFYHFLHPGNVKAQATYFVERSASLPGDPLFVDWENTATGTRASCAEKDQFIAEVKRLRGSSHRVGLYCNRDFWLNRDTTGQAGDALWIADYVTAGKPRIQAKWLFHQYTDEPLDTNVGAFANRAALKAWATKLAPVDPPMKPSTPTPKDTTMADTTAQKVSALHSNLTRIGSLTEKDAKGARVEHAAGYYLAHVQEDTSVLRVQVAALLKAVADLTALIKG